MSIESAVNDLNKKLDRLKQMMEDNFNKQVGRMSYETAIALIKENEFCRACLESMRTCKHCPHLVGKDDLKIAKAVVALKGNDVGR